MSEYFQDPAFWYAVSFTLFVVVVGRKLVNLIRDTVQEHRQAIVTELKEAKALQREAEHAHAQIRHELEHWADEEKTKRRHQDQQLEDLKKSYHENYEKLRDQKIRGNDSYIQAKEIESRKRLESFVAEDITLNVKKDLLS